MTRLALQTFQTASKVDDQVALALPFLKMEMFAAIMPTFWDSFVAPIFWLALASAMRNALPRI